MSIHLDAFHPEVTEKGITFFADVNAKRICCILSKEALRLLQKEKDGQKHFDPLALFNEQWAEIKSITYSKIQENKFRSNGDLILGPSDFE